MEIFDANSPTHQELVATRIDSIVSDPADRSRFLALLAASPIEISYADLKGNALGGPRALDPCNGIVQATLPGQQRPYMSDWASENFVRWAHSLGFIEYDPGNDTFSLSSLGQQYINMPATNGINSVLEDAFLSYPPAVRVLRLLAQHTQFRRNFGQVRSNDCRVAKTSRLGGNRAEVGHGDCRGAVLYLCNSASLHSDQRRSSGAASGRGTLKAQQNTEECLL